MWRSILGARKVLERGLRWRVGNGVDLYFWEEKWVPFPSTFRLLSPKPNNNQAARVCDFLDFDRDVDRLRGVVLPVDIDRIFSIPLYSPTTADKLVWHYCKDGIFTVKSAYIQALLLKQEEGQTKSGGSSLGGKQKALKILWGFKIPNKMKDFLWRSWNNTLPTRFELCKRHEVEGELQLVLALYLARTITQRILTRAARHTKRIAIY